jgi:asparaginyl-tRNA synthetase
MATRACFAAFATSGVRTGAAFGLGSRSVVRSVGRSAFASSSGGAISSLSLGDRYTTLSPLASSSDRYQSTPFQLRMTNSDATVSPPRVKTAEAQVSEDPVSIKGWVKTVRKQKTLAFVEVNDGSNMGGIQCVVPFDGVDEDTLAAIDNLTTGCSVHATGLIVNSQGGKQSVELSASSLRVVGTCPGETFPLAKKRHSLEYLRTIAHLRPRTNTIAAVARVRSTLAGSIHSFFQGEGFQYVQTPLITASDCEGAGEMFRVTTLNTDDVSSLPRAKDEDGKELPGVDYAEDFFGKAAFLTVSGQLGGETYACALGDVYTFGPTFRAENSQTARHLAEFWMVEPEMAFADLTSAMDNAESMLKSVVGEVLEKCDEDLTFFANFFDKGLKNRLKKVVEKPFVRVAYRDAIGYLQEEIAKDPSKWQFPEVEFGTDLATEHERWLAETKFESAVFVYNYPKKIKAFYMRDNDEDGGETVNAMDLLVPGVGELVGGSQREERLDVLIEKMKELGLNEEDYWWYLDLRRFGSVPHAGYGLGFERLVTYVCGIENIRDAIAYPRYPGNAEF